MTDRWPSSVPRRGFLGRLLGGSLAAAAGSLGATPLLAQTEDDAAGGGAEHVAMLGAAAAPSDTDMSWVARITADRRIVFDAAQVEEGIVLHHARTTLTNFAEVEHTTDADWSMVVTIRHAAIPMVLNDAMWAKYAFLGKSTKLKDPASGKRPARNPFLNANVGKDDRYAMIWPDGGLDTLVRRGVIVLGCGLALRRLSGELAGDTKQDAKAVHQEVLTSLVPGVYVMPSGIFGTVRAEEAGCRFFKSS
jgi:hypothetical protein